MAASYKVAVLANQVGPSMLPAVGVVVDAIDSGLIVAGDRFSNAAIVATATTDEAGIATFADISGTTHWFRARMAESYIIEVIPAAASGDMISGRRIADYTVAESTTLEDAPLMTFAVGANESWIFWAMVMVNPVGGGGFKMQFNGPAGSYGRYGIDLDVATEGLVSRWVFGSPVAWAPAERPSVAYTNNVFGMINTVGTAGTVQLQIAQQVSNAVGVTLESGSWILGLRVS